MIMIVFTAATNPFNYCSNHNGGCRIKREAPQGWRALDDEWRGSVTEGSPSHPVTPADTPDALRHTCDAAAHKTRRHTCPAQPHFFSSETLCDTHCGVTYPSMSARMHFLMHFIFCFGAPSIVITSPHGQAWQARRVRRG